MYPYILFDLDGTISNPKPGITKSVQYALNKMGYPVPTMDELEIFIGPPLLDSFMKYCGMDKETAEKAITTYRERFSTIGLFENDLYPEMKELLADLHANGARLAVASSKPEVFVKRILEYFHIAEYFSVVVGSELDGRRTDKTEVVQEALRRLVASGAAELEEGTEAMRMEDLPKDKIAMVGDRKFDVEGANALGLHAVAVSYGYAPEGELENCGAEFVADTVTELRTILKAGLA